MHRKIFFPRKGLSLEEIISLIYFDETNFDFDEKIHDIIIFLRNHSKCIKEIGYLDYLQGKTKHIRVLLKIDSNILTNNELELLDKISY